MFIESLEARLLLSTDVLTYHNDNSRDGENLTETTLTPANVNPAKFGKLYSFPVDGALYAQPLYMADVPVTSSKGRVTDYNLVFVATENDSVYAFNADSSSTRPLWKASFIDPAKHVTPIPSSATGSDDLTPEIGITSTPVIDSSTNTIYVVACTQEIRHHQVSYVQRLHALDISTGAEKFGGPVTLTATQAGTGDGGTTDTFQALIENQRCALLLSNSIVYVTFASHGDIGPYHGWVFGYDAATLKQVAIFNDTPNGTQGGVWESGDGIAADAQGNLYLTTGNGTFDANTRHGADYGDSALRLTPTKNGLAVTDYFTPFNQAGLNDNDLDLGSGGVILLPAQKGSHRHEMVFAGKQGPIYLVDCDDMGGFNASGDDVVEILHDQIASLFSTPAYYNGSLYLVGTNGPLMAFSLHDGKLSKTPTSESATDLGQFGATPCISANGSTNGIVWAVGQDNGQAVLTAYNAANIAQQLYSSEDAGSRDDAGEYVKFVPPTIADGKVFVSTQTQVSVFGLLPGKHSR